MNRNSLDTRADMLEKLKQHLSESSRALAYLTADMVYENPALMASLVELSWTTDPHAQRSSHIVCICTLRFPELIKPYSSTIIKKLEHARSEGVIRNFIKIFAEVPVALTKMDKSRLINLCFNYLTTSRYAVAIKVFSMQVLYNLSREFPEIGMELILILQDQYHGSSPGYRSRAQKILRKLGSVGKQDLS
jgi:hypothetical protein